MAPYYLHHHIADFGKKKFHGEDVADKWANNVGPSGRGRMMVWAESSRVGCVSVNKHRDLDTGVWIDDDENYFMCHFDKGIEPSIQNGDYVPAYKPDRGFQKGRV